MIRVIGTDLTGELVCVLNGEAVVRLHLSPANTFAFPVGVVEVVPDGDSDMEAVQRRMLADAGPDGAGRSA